VRLLPRWDNLLLTHADRTRVLPEELGKTVIAKNGDVAETFLVDGVVAGTWRLVGEHVELESFVRSPASSAASSRTRPRQLESFAS